ncbi:MAG: replicative DNA helicase [Planctomycetaceae bacterium]
MPAGSADSFDGKMSPQNLDAERGVLGSILLLNEALDEVADFLHADHFYEDGHRKIYSAIFDLYEKAVRVDALTLAEELGRRGQLQEIGGAPAILQILESVPHAAHAKYYANIVREKSIQRSLIYTCTEVLRECYAASSDTEDILERAEQGIFRILSERESIDRMSIGEILFEAFDRIKERLEKEGSISGLSTGFLDLDARTNGFQPSELIVLAARPSMGKTALICNWSEAVAESGTSVLIFSLEQSKVELAERFLCIRARVNSHNLRAGSLDEAEHHELLRASSELTELPLFIDDTPGRTMGQISAVSRRMKRQKGVGLVIIDYLQLIEPEDRRAPREQQVAQITRRLKFLCKELNVPVIALAQLNRSVESRRGEDQRPRLSDLRESGAIEQDSDVVMLLHRPEVYNEEDPDVKGLAEVIIAKNRSGPVGTVRLTWRSESMRFENFSNAHMPDGGYFAGGDGF